MIRSTIDSVVYEALSRVGRPIHWYEEILRYVLTCLKEIGYDSAGTLSAVRLEVNEFNEIDIPADFIDWVRIGTEYGNKIIPLGQNDGMNRLQNLDGATQVPYESPDNLTLGSILIGAPIVETNQYGEHLGRRFGHGDGSQTNGFKVIEERSKIAIDTAIAPGTTIYLEYIARTTLAPNTAVHPYAEETLVAYAVWKFKQKDPSFGLQEKNWAKEEYYNAYRILRARVVNWNIYDIKRVIRRHFKGTPKV